MRSLAQIQSFAASQAVPGAIEVIRAAGGASGITLTVTPPSYTVQEPSGITVAVYETFTAIRTDDGDGTNPVKFVDSTGALFNGDTSWNLINQNQWAIFCWTGTGWDVFGN
jgi:hypothetical protein